jgi:hypothetical protein
MLNNPINIRNILPLRFNIIYIDFHQSEALLLKKYSWRGWGTENIPLI